MSLAFDHLFVFTLHLRRGARPGVSADVEAPIVCVFDHPPSGEDIILKIASSRCFNRAPMVVTMREELAHLPGPSLLVELLDEADRKHGWPSITRLSSDYLVVMSFSRHLVPARDC